AVVAAAILVGVAAVGGHHHRAAMGALVVHEPDRAIHVARQQQRLAADAGGDEVAGIFDLALVADVNPRHAEDTRELQLENPGGGVEPTMHPPGLHQRPDLLSRQAHCAAPCALPAPTDILSLRGADTTERT